MARDDQVDIHRDCGHVRDYEIIGIQFGQDELGDYWKGQLLKHGSPVGVMGTYNDIGPSPTGFARLSKDDQIELLLLNPDVSDEAYRVKLIYDGACGFCCRTAQWVRGLDKCNLLRVVPFQSMPLESLGLSARDFTEDFWVMCPRLGKLRTLEAVERVFEIVGVSGLVLAAFHFRPTRWLLSVSLRFIMSHRHWLVWAWNAPAEFTNAAH